MKIIVGIGGVTNGGKTTLANSLCKALPNCCVIHQDDFFKPQDQIAVGEDGFKQWDALESLDMEAMLGTVQDWLHSPQKFARAHGVCLQPDAPDTHVLLLDGFLLYSYRPLLDLYSRRYFLTVPYEECKCRRRWVAAGPAPRVPPPRCDWWEPRPGLPVPLPSAAPTATQSPVPLSSLMATCGPCTRSISRRWRQPAWTWCSWTARGPARSSSCRCWVTSTSCCWPPACPARPRGPSGAPALGCPLVSERPATGWLRPLRDVWADSTCAFKGTGIPHALVTLVRLKK
ncbi:nicotinamide riboside kinase 2 isoform X2 [Cavia porcellus]|uniref:nicotinamide riboside kinase 2 isoform X2 n=1 Tax=Cavia porcellus TaxID=10141 RepID=UPI002FE1313F